MGGSLVREEAICECRLLSFIVGDPWIEKLKSFKLGSKSFKLGSKSVKFRSSVCNLSA